MYMYMTQKSEGVNINCMSRCRSTSSTSIHGQHGLLHECMLHTMQMHQVHQESRDFFPSSLATGTEPQIPGQLACMHAVWDPEDVSGAGGGCRFNSHDEQVWRPELDAGSHVKGREAAAKHCSAGGLRWLGRTYEMAGTGNQAGGGKGGGSDTPNTCTPHENTPGDGITVNYHAPPCLSSNVDLAVNTGSNLHFWWRWVLASMIDNLLQ